MNQAQSLIALAEAQFAQTGGKVDGVGHSTGGLVLAIAACTQPGLFRNLVLIEVVGMMGKNDSIVQLVRRQVKESSKVAAVTRLDAQAAKVKKLADQSFRKHILWHLPTSISELNGITQVPLPELVDFIRKKGIKVTMIHAVDEEVNPMSAVLSNAPEVDGFYSVIGQHNDIQFHPEVFTKVVNDALDGMEAQRTREVK